ncbi:MAG: pyridoxamine 5'-phosphate oxidase family protein [Pseudomonadota bacterium]
MFHEAVADLQRADGGYQQYQIAYQRRTQSGLSPEDIAFIESRESVYLASVTPAGWPYVQHRGGPPGFLRVLGPTRLACADYRGNRQFISMGNLGADDRVSLFLMDYVRKARLKIQGRATLRDLADADPDVVGALSLEGVPVERILTIDVVAMDWNCPKYIPGFYPEAVVTQAIARATAPLQAEIEELKAKLALKD